MTSSTRRARIIDVAALVMLSLAGLFAAMSAAALPREPARGVGLVFAPWTKPETVLTRVAAAGGRFVRFGGASFVAIAIPDDSDRDARTLASGAWLAVDPFVISACASLFASRLSAPKVPQ